MEELRVNGKGMFKYAMTGISIESDFELILNPLLKVFRINARCGISQIELPLYPWSMEGFLDTGEPVFAHKMALTTQGEYFHKDGFYKSLGFEAVEVSIGKDCLVDVCRFWFPNLIIGFDEFTQVDKSVKRILTNLELVYDNQSYIVQFKSLKGLLNVDMVKGPTSTFTVEVSVRKKEGRCSPKTARKIVEMLSFVLSIAYGGSVNWLYAEGEIQQTRVWLAWQDVPFSNKPTRQLIDVRMPYELSSFVKIAYESLLGFRQNEQSALRRLINGIHLSAERLVFPIPFAVLGAVIEDYSNYILSDVSTHYIDKKTRIELLPSFKEFIDTSIMPFLDNDDRNDFEGDDLKQKFSQLVQRNLRTRIYALFKHFEIPYKNDEVRVFVKKRNDAVHGTYRYEARDYMIWTRIASNLDLIVLKQLRYEGPFYDHSTSPVEKRSVKSVLRTS